MKYVKEKGKLYHYDVQMVQKAREFLVQDFMKGEYGESKETAQELVSLLESILSSFKYEEIDVERKVKETEEEAREYFGEDFITQFEQIRSYCNDNNLMLAIHGTNPQNLKPIQQEGLMYERPDISETAIIQAGTDTVEHYDNYTGLLNWPHREYKGLVLLGIPRECNGILAHGEKETKPLWTEIKTDTDFSKSYRINPEFIIGVIDVDKKLILGNPLFSLNHDYSGLKYDHLLTDYGRRISIPIDEIKLYQQEQEQILTNNNYEDLSDEETKEEKKTEEILVDVYEELQPIFPSLIRAKGKMKESDIKEFIDGLKHTTTLLQNVIPQLKERQEIENEAESFIGDNDEEFEWDDDIDWDETENTNELDNYTGSFMTDFEEDNEIREDMLNSAVEATEEKLKNSDINKQLGVIIDNNIQKQQSVGKEK